MNNEQKSFCLLVHERFKALGDFSLDRGLSRALAEENEQNAEYYAAMLIMEAAKRGWRVAREAQQCIDLFSKVPDRVA